MYYTSTSSENQGLGVESLISEAEDPGSGAKKHGTLRHSLIKKCIGKWRKVSNKKGAQTALQLAP